MKKISFVIMLIFISLNIIAQEFSSLVVEGKAIVKEIPENILISISLSSKDPDYSVCSDNLTKNSNNFQKELTSQGIDPKIIKTRGFNIEEDTEYQNNTRKKIGYKGTVNLSIECPFSNKVVSTVMETIKKNPYQFTYTVNFVLSESQKQGIINSSIEKSIADAKLKAEIIAKASNLELVRINSIKYSKDYFSYETSNDVISLVDQRIRFNEPMLMVMEPTDEMTINQEELAVEKTVTVEWITRSK
jgi:uncharacterized protein